MREVERAAGGWRVHMPSLAADSTRNEKRAHAEHERATAAQGATLRAADGGPGGAPTSRGWHPTLQPLVRVRGWGGAGCCGPAQAGGVPETSQGGAFEVPRTTPSATRPHAALPTRRATPTLARGLVRAPVSTRSPPRGSGWGTRHATLYVRLRYDRLEGKGGPGANRDQKNLITGRLTPGDDGSASLPTYM